MKRIVELDLDEEIKKLLLNSLYGKLAQLEKKKEYENKLIVYVISDFTVVVLFGLMFMISLYNTYLTRFNTTALLLNCVGIFMISCVYMAVMLSEDNKFQEFKKEFKKLNSSSPKSQNS